MDCEDSSDGLPLPLFSGRLSADWSAHETRLNSWLRVKGIPTHAREASDTLLLSLEPDSTASLTFSRAPAADRATYDEGITYLRTEFDSLLRKRLAQGSAQNALDLRGFRERGRRRELVKDLVGDLERLMLKAGVTEDEAKRQALLRSFLEFPAARRLLSKTASWDSAVSEALRWEAIMIQKEQEAIVHARERLDPNTTPKTPRVRQPHSAVPPPDSPSPTPSRDTPATNSPYILDDPSPGSKHGGGGGSIPSTIEELAEGDPFVRPDNPSPYFQWPQDDPIVPPRSFSAHLRPPVASSRTDRPQDDLPVRSHSVDFALTTSRLRPRLVDFEGEADRPASTPPFVADEIHWDEEDGEGDFDSRAGGTDGRRSALEARPSRKLVRRPSEKTRKGDASRPPSSTASTRLSVVARLFGSVRRRSRVMTPESGVNGIVWDSESKLDVSEEVGRLPTRRSGALAGP